MLRLHSSPRGRVVDDVVVGEAADVHHLDQCAPQLHPLPVLPEPQSVCQHLHHEGTDLLALFLEVVVTPGDELTVRGEVLVHQDVPFDAGVQIANRVSHLAKLLCSLLTLRLQFIKQLLMFAFETGDIPHSPLQTLIHEHFVLLQEVDLLESGIRAS